MSNLPIFPPEVIDQIVDHLALAGSGPWKGLLKDLKSCCLASKTFVVPCQKHLFRTVHLHPGKTISTGSYSWVRPSTSQRFADVFVHSHVEPTDDSESPARDRRRHVASFVRELKYDADITQDSEFIHLVLPNMTRVVDLEINVQQKDIDPGQDFLFLHRAPSNWKQAIYGALSQGGLKTLRLQKLVLSPDDLIDNCELESLSLDGCTMHNWEDEAYYATHLDPPSKTRHL